MAHLACQRAIRRVQQSDTRWQSLNWGRRAAAIALDEISNKLRQYAVDREDLSWMVAGPGVEKTPCLGQWLD
jgi:hypothetical protein